jgi:SAM-dependent methyltransferase
MDLGQHYRHYWRRMELREQAERYRAPCLRWHHCDGLNPTERVVFERVRAAGRLLDFGAGDLRLKRKFIAAGFAGRYETLDISEEFPHEYTDIAQVSGPFGAILCLEVIEHLPLTAFDALVNRLCELLEPGGALVISTPNPLCVVPMWARDSGHIQQYPLHDLIAALLARGVAVDPFRVRFVPARPSAPQRLRLLSQRLLCYLLGVDYADGLLVIGTKT